jgi:hypothetical protein
MFLFAIEFGTTRNANTACASLQHALLGSQGGPVGILLRSVRVFRRLMWLEVGSGKLALSHPARLSPPFASRGLPRRWTPVFGHRCPIQEREF